MNTVAEWFAALSTPARVALITLGALQLTLQITALVDLSRRSAVTGGRKWVWLLVSLLGGLVGAAAYLAVGRAPTPLHGGGDTPPAGSESARRRALETLYGGDDARD